MSKLEELIQELCPDGVEYKKLGEIVEYQRGKSITKKNVIEGDIPVISGGQQPAYYHNESNRKGKTITIAGSGAYAGYIMYWEKPIFVSDAFSLKGNAISINTKYIYYYLKKIQEKIYSLRKGAGISHVYFKDMQDFLVPVPPLEVQCEIVRILDNFTLLTAELTAELTARRKQYEYYRNYILNNVKAEKKELSDVCDFLRGPFGSSLKKEYFKESGYVVYEQQHAIYQKLDFRYFIDADKFSELKRFEVKPGELIVSCSGTIGKVFVIPENAPKGIINQALLNLKPKDFVKAKYIKYFFENTLGEVLNNSARGGAIKNVPSVGELKKIKIYIPCKDEQKKIISTLDRFDKLCNDIISGIPAEIEVRQKQYEYYRDKLLTFKEKNNE